MLNRVVMNCVQCKFNFILWALFHVTDNSQFHTRLSLALTAGYRSSCWSIQYVKVSPQETDWKSTRGQISWWKKQSPIKPHLQPSAVFSFDEKLIPRDSFQHFTFPSFFLASQIEVQMPLSNSVQTLNRVKLVNLLNHLNTVSPQQHFILSFYTVSIWSLYHNTVKPFWTLKLSQDLPPTLLKLHLCNLCQKWFRLHQDHLGHKQTQTHTHTRRAKPQASNTILSSTRHQVGRLWRELCQCVSVWVFPLLLSLSPCLSPSIALTYSPSPFWDKMARWFPILHVNPQHTDCSDGTPTPDPLLCFTQLCL